MRLLVPTNVKTEDILNHLRKLPEGSFLQVAQDWVHSRFPSFNHEVLHVDSSWNEIDCICAICYTNAEYQLDCGHIFHKRCLNQWKNRTCPLCRAPF